MSGYEDLREKIARKKCRVCVVGLGYIGFPTALFYQRSGYQVVGVDLNTELVANLRQGKVSMIEAGLEEIAAEVLPKIELHSEYNSLEDIDIFVLCLPSPIDIDKTPNVTYLENSLSDIASIAKNHTLIIIESTVPVGFTEGQMERFKQMSSLAPDEEFWFAHSPERVLPGSVVKEMEDNDRLIGGVTEKATDLGYLFLAGVFGEGKIHKTNSKTSETSKLAENAFRDSSIAFANELARLSTEIGIDVREVIRLANLHPRVDILEPGLGVGGYCFPKDGWILVNSMKQTKEIAQVIPAARFVNDSMPNHTLRRIKSELGEEYGRIRQFGVLGVSYKPNVNDTRMSPALALIELLEKEKREVVAYDPLVKGNSDISMVDNLDDLVEFSEIIILAVNHNGIVDLLLSYDLSRKVIVDPAGVLLKEKKRFREYIGLSI